MRVYLINLEKDIDRRVAFAAQANRFGIDYTVTKAVYAKGEVDGLRMCLGDVVSRFRWWCAMGRPVRFGEVGCALSHYNIYREMVTHDIPIACILEDDVVIDDRFLRVIGEVERNYPQGRPFVGLLSNHSDPMSQGGDDFNGFCSSAEQAFELRRTYWDLFTEGYVITKEAAEAILFANFPLITPCDQWMRWAGHGVIDLYHVFPTVCSQNKGGFASSTIEGATLVSDMSWIRRKLHKVMRGFGRVADCLLWHCTGR